MVVSITLSTYSIISLHMASSPETPCFGLLIGTSSKNAHTISHGFPVSHSAPVGPIFELACSLAESLSPNEKVIGIYSTGLGSNLTQNLLLKIKEIINEDPIELIFSSEAAQDNDKLMYECMINNKKIELKSISLSIKEYNQQLNQYLSLSKQHLLNDFDTYLNTSLISNKSTYLSYSNYIQSYYKNLLNE